MNDSAANLADEQPITRTESWPAAVEAMLAPIYRFVRARAPADAVDDLVQEVFVAASRSIGAFDGRCPLWNWLTVIARNKIAEHYRRSGLRSRLEQALEMLTSSGNREVMEALAGETPLPEEICQREEFRTVARAVLSSMTPEQRDCLVGRYYEDLSLEALSRRLGVSRAAANTRLHRARQEFRRAFLQLLKYGPDDQEFTP